MVCSRLAFPPQKGHGFMRPKKSGPVGQSNEKAPGHLSATEGSPCYPVTRPGKDRRQCPRRPGKILSAPKDRSALAGWRHRPTRSRCI